MSKYEGGSLHQTVPVHNSPALSINNHHLAADALITTDTIETVEEVDINTTMTDKIIDSAVSKRHSRYFQYFVFYGGN